ncbi:MAG: hypothetical protein H6Q69_413 [Firmicutes bacterium]|nr:hypothetical protein [Bacillota bacterium]
MKGLEGLFGGVMVSIRRREKKAAQVGILIMRFCIRHLLMCLMRWLKTKIIFFEQWQQRLENGNSLQRYKARQFIGILMNAKPLNEFDVDLYFTMVEKMTVFDGGRLIVSLLDGTDMECETE